MEDPCVGHTGHSCRLTDIHKTRIDSPHTVPSSSPRIAYVNLYVKCKTITENFVMDRQHVINLISTDIQFQPRLDKIVLPVTEKGDIDLDALKNIDAEHNGWPLPDSNCRPWLVKTILDSVRDTVQVFSRLIHYNIGLDIIYEVVIKQHHITTASDVTDWLMQRSFEESFPKMVPASDSSIKSLMRAIIVGVGDDGGCERCSICLEDFLAGSEVSCIPCSHVFHGDCIGEWLRKSHYCPNCRYEMPTNE